jgi:23S rRNA pseudouridine2605 synthase
MEERLHKILANAGFGSRRACEDLIREGRVTLNGVTVTRMGMKVDPATAEITCDGMKVEAGDRTTYLLFKPAGIPCEGVSRPNAPTVLDFFPTAGSRLFVAGAFEAAAEGLVVVTNDGAVAEAVTHARYRTPKVYWIGAKEGREGIHPDILAQLRRGETWYPEGDQGDSEVTALPAAIDGFDFALTIREWGGRTFRTVLARHGIIARRARRVSIGPFELRGLKIGHSRKLDEATIERFLGESESHQERRKPRGLVPKAERRKVGGINAQASSPAATRRPRPRPTPEEARGQTGGKGKSRPGSKPGVKRGGPKRAGAFRKGGVKKGKGSPKRGGR